MRHLVKHQQGYVLRLLYSGRGPFSSGGHGKHDEGGRTIRGLSRSLEERQMRSKRNKKRKRKVEKKKKKKVWLGVPGLFVSITNLAVVSPRPCIWRCMGGSSCCRKTAGSFRNYTFLVPVINRTRVWQTAPVYGSADGWLAELQLSAHKATLSIIHALLQTLCQTP